VTTYLEISNRYFI